MKKSAVTLFVLLFAAFNLNAQMRISGTVRDAETGEQLAGATVMIDGTQAGTTADVNGYFELTAPAKGDVSVKASYVGYDTKVKQVNLNADIRLNFELYRREIVTDQVVVTASRSRQAIGDIPGRVSLLSARTIAATPSESIDDIFRQVSGIYVDRSSGIITSSVTVNVRGITSNEQGRVLALVDGMPVNKSDGGTVNWNRINVEDVERVEIFKGPGSSIYGNNAMGGVINIITKQNASPGYNAFANAEYGTLNTFGQRAGISGRVKELNGLTFRLSGFNRTSDGYNSTREAYRDQFSVASNLKESGIDAKLGYDFSPNTNLLFNFNFYDDKRGQGTFVKTDNYMKQKNTYGVLAFNAGWGNAKLTAGAFYQKENYLRVSEKYKTNSAGALTSYDRYNVDAARVDLGGNANITMPLASTEFTAGIEIKQGSIDGSDIYQTSTDVVTNRGKMLFLAAFVQDSYNITGAFTLSAGVRADYIKFFDGEFVLTNPTSTTSFMNVVSGPIAGNNWTKITPKLTAQYRFAQNLKAYAAYSQGFRAATLDDLTRPGLIRLGFKNANPSLKPEQIDNYEIGFNYDLDKQLFVMPSFYYMEGNDFMYYINTGTTINVSGKNRPIIIKDNITRVRFIGADIDVKYFISANLYATANYTYTNSKILNYTGNPALEGKQLTYTPAHLANFGITYLNTLVNGTLLIHYQGKQFTQDDNSTTDANGNSMVIEGNATVDLKFWKKAFGIATFGLNVENLFDVQTLTTYDRVSFGRMISGELTVEL